jgi:cobalamin biosynthesis Mg chelatase CobN
MYRNRRSGAVMIYSITPPGAQRKDYGTMESVSQLQHAFRNAYQGTF